MAEDDRIRVEVAFDGGQVMSVLLSSADAEAVERALGDDDRATVSVDADDGRYTLALRRVVYVKRFKRESRVGFRSS